VRFFVKFQKNDNDYITMKLDPRNIRHLSQEDWRVLSAVRSLKSSALISTNLPHQVEQGSRNHEVVPTPLIASIAHFSSRTGINRYISTLAKLNLISRVKNARYDGYRLTYGGLDYLALHSHLKADTIFSVGNRVGVGKEADIIIVAPPNSSSTHHHQQLILKIHRLGRISFRTVKKNRDYLRNRAAGNWMYMSRLAAMKEYAVLQALFDTGFPVPVPFGWNRHTLVMSLVEGTPLRSVSEVPDPPELYGQLIELILRFAGVGLIHGDFNEFNILIEEVESTASSTKDGDNQLTPSTSQSQSPEISLRPVIIDFPQSLSISHPNAEFYFDRDVACIKRFFLRRFGFTSSEPGPFFADAIKNVGPRRLDVEVEASGFSRKMAAELQRYIEAVGANEDKDETTEGVDDDGGEHEIDREDEWTNGDGGNEYADGVDEDVNDVEIEADPSAPLPMAVENAVEKLTIADQLDDSVSVAGSVRSRRIVNPVKASRGWAI
jgi:RIO kinase 2